MPEHIVIIAGEESGDRHAAEFAEQLLASNPTLEITGIGGRHLEAAGVRLISDLARYGVTGFTEVIRHAWVIKKAFKDIKNHLRECKPDLLILVDYPGFNLRLAQYAKHKLGLRIIYYISPQIWAWKANRIETIRACVDHMAVILPFEKEIYTKAGIAASFVGHPLVNNIPEYPDLNKLRHNLGLPADKKLIAMLPGSRRNEITRHMPVMAATIKALSRTSPDVHFVIPVAGTLDPKLLKTYVTDSRCVTFLEGQALEAAACSDCVVVASGTASLECALLEKPMCIIYKASWLTYFAAMKLIRVKYLGLCNLLQNKLLVPELLQDDCNVEELTKMVTKLLFDDAFKKRMKGDLRKLKYSLSNNEADCSIFSLIQGHLESSCLRIPQNK